MTKVATLPFYLFSRSIDLFAFCRVLTPYYTEEVLFSLRELEEPNEDGVSILFYLQKIFPGLVSLMYIEPLSS